MTIYNVRKHMTNISEIDTRRSCYSDDVTQFQHTNDGTIYQSLLVSI